MHLSDIKKIAVVRANALGDFIFALPALSAIKQTYPQATLYYLGKQWHQDFLSKRRNPVDKVFVIPPIPGVGMPEDYQQDDQQVANFFETMRNEHYDIAIQLHGGGQYSNMFVQQLSARLTIGMKAENAISLDKTIPYHYYQNEYLRLLEVVSLIDAKTYDPMPHIRVNKQDIQEALHVIGEKKGRIIILHPGATDSKRRWPSNRFAAIGKYFALRGYRILITGSGDEENLIREVCKDTQVPFENLYNKLSLHGLTGLLFLCDLLIANDTGPLHLANAIGIKTVGLYWCANMITAAPPFRNNTIALSSWIIRCPLCGADCTSVYPFENKKMTNCRHQVSFITNISVNEVITAANTLLDRR